MLTTLLMFVLIVVDLDIVKIMDHVEHVVDMVVTFVIGQALLNVWLALDQAGSKSGAHAMYAMAQE